MAKDPETADYRPYPKGPNFLGIVIGFCVVILVVAIATIILLHTAGKKIFPMKTNTTPSQTILHQLAPPLRNAAGDAVTETA